jgi:hypothetical protein
LPACGDAQFGALLDRVDGIASGIGGCPLCSKDGTGFSDSCQQNGDVPKTPFTNRQPLPSVGTKSISKSDSWLGSQRLLARIIHDRNVEELVHPMNTMFFVMLASGESERIIHLERLAKLHSRAEMDIKPELYDLWLDQLVQAVKEFDLMFAPETETAWRHVLQPGIEFMKSRY